MEQKRVATTVLSLFFIQLLHKSQKQLSLDITSHNSCSANIHVLYIIDVAKNNK